MEIFGDVNLGCKSRGQIPKSSFSVKEKCEKREHTDISAKNGK